MGAKYFHEAAFAHGSDKEAVKIRSGGPHKSKYRPRRIYCPSGRSYEEQDAGGGNSESIGRGRTPANRPFGKRMVQNESWEWSNQIGSRKACDIASRLDAAMEEDRSTHRVEEETKIAPGRVEVDLMEMARPARRRRQKGRTMSMGLPLRAEYLETNDIAGDLLSWADESEWGGTERMRRELEASDWESDWESTADWEDVEDDFYEEPSRTEVPQSPTYAQKLRERPR